MTCSVWWRLDHDSGLSFHCTEIIVSCGVMLDAFRRVLPQLGGGIRPAIWKIICNLFLGNDGLLTKIFLKKKKKQAQEQLLEQWLFLGLIQNVAAT